MIKGILLGLVTLSAFASTPHIPLELTFEESRQWQKTIEYNQSLKNGDQEEFETTREIELATSAGEILGKWLEKINENRGDDPIRLTSVSTRRGIPIDKPSKYGPSTVEKTYKEFQESMPKAMFAVFFENAPLTSELPVEKDLFIEWARKLSKHYQSAVRWTGMQRWRGYYTQRRFDDVRGYYHLKNLKDLDGKLDTYTNLSTEDKAELKKHLLGICLNTTHSESQCESHFQAYASKNRLKSFKNKYWNHSEKLWRAFFDISSPRHDVEWSHKNPYVMEVPFLNPERTDIANWLKENVEDEFRREEFNWSLLLSFVDRGFGISRLDFKPNVTPHVSGGNLIVMDANTSLEEYSVKWTIRHEYGHILRLPDCYFEFYSPEENLMINYQLDVTDLMCSRAGDMNDRIYHELKRVYFK